MSLFVLLYCFINVMKENATEDRKYKLIISFSDINSYILSVDAFRTLYTEKYCEK